MLQFFLAPFLTLFSLRFYRSLLALPKSLGFLYIGYWALLFSIWGITMFRLQSLPVADDLITWLSQTLPRMTLTQEGMKLELSAPQLLTHPQWGDLIYLDPTSDQPNIDPGRGIFVIVTRTNLAVLNPIEGNYRVQSLVPQLKTGTRWQDQEITGSTIMELWRRLKPLISALFVVLVFIFVYVWKLLAGLLYSLIGLVLNTFRKDRLSYGCLLQLAFFALSPVCLLQIIGWSFPGLKIPVNLWVSLLITTLYLGLAILGTQKKESSTINYIKNI